MLNLPWLSENAPLINSVGISFNIIGASLVAWKLVGQHTGKRHPLSIGVAVSDLVAGQEAENTKKPLGWKLNNYTKMQIGFAFLAFGFALQLLSNWVK